MIEIVGKFNTAIYYGVRKIRNIMTHREAYQYCLEDSNGKALPFGFMLGTLTGLSFEE